jgi:hypothetical protein
VRRHDPLALPSLEGVLARGGDVDLQPSGGMSQEQTVTRTHDEQTAGANEESTGVGRRALVRVGATAAWVVPAVAIAAPASAATCSGGSTSLTAVKVGEHRQSGHPKLEVTQRIQVCNTGESATCALSARARTTGGSTKLNKFEVEGWPRAHVSGGGARSLVVSAGADDQIQPGECVTYLVTFTLHDASHTHNTAIDFFSSNGGMAGVSVHTQRTRHGHGHG